MKKSQYGEVTLPEMRFTLCIMNLITTVFEMKKSQPQWRGHVSRNPLYLVYHEFYHHLPMTGVVRLVISVMREYRLLDDRFLDILPS